VAAAEHTWRGFDPTGYEIQWKLLSEAPLTEMCDGSNRVQTTAGAILREALPHLFTPLNDDLSVGVTPPRRTCEVEEGTGWLTIKAPSRVIKLDTLGNGSGFAADLVATVIKVDQLPEHQSFHPIFFYYDRDRVVDDVHESFSFFVVNDDRFVLDRVTFSRHSGNGFDPGMFKPFYEVEHQIWASEPHVEQAKVRWWYRRFYEETDAGRLTLLHDDIDLYHYVPEWKQRQVMAASIEQIARSTAQLQKLVIYALIALALIVILLWR
jgi:hypothetical protein